MIWYLPNLLAILLIGWWLKPEAKLHKVYWSGMFIKMLAGIALGYLYFAELGAGDTIRFHHQASHLYQLFRNSFPDYLDYLFTAHYPVYMSEARNELFVKLISIFYVLSGGDYWICSLYLSLISFLGSWYFVKSVRRFYPKLWYSAVIGFLFVPSAVFWSSGVLKDPLVNSSVFFLAGICCRYSKTVTFRWWEIGCSVLALLLLFYLKYYLLAVVLLTLGTLSWSKVVMLLPRFWQRATLAVVTGLGLILLASNLNWNLNFDHLPGAIHSNYTIIYKNSISVNALEFPSLAPTWSSILAHLPKGLFAGLFRPLPGEGTIFHWIYGLENGLLLCLAFVNIFFIRKIKINLTGWLAILYIIILASFLPLVSPNFGSLVRYKAAYLPLLVFLLTATPLAYLYQKKQANKKLN